MNFRFLYDPQRRILSIGYRLADAEGPGRLDLSYYDLLASEARLASFIGIAKGDLPETHWFHLGRLITSVDGRPTLLSWSATLFEYLMPLLVMRSYPETLLDQTCRMAVRRQLEYGVERGVPWGMSESAYNLVDLHDNYQYKAFGVPGLGLKRGLGDELVVAPYATALASMLEPALAAENFRRLAAAGLSGACGYYEAIDYTHQRMDAPTGAELPADRSPGVVVRAFMAHHQGMTLVALSNALLGDRMVGRFHADPRMQATELLLQERVPRRRAHHPAAAGRRDARGRAGGHDGRSPLPLGAHAVPARAVPVQRQLRGGGDQRRRRRELLPWPCGDAPPGRSHAATPAASSSTCATSGAASCGPPRSSRWATSRRTTSSTFLAEKATFRRRDDDIGTQLDIAVSTEDDVEVRRLAVTNHSDRVREIDVTSYVEIVLAPPADDLAHPAFGKLFVETEYLPESAALLVPPASRARRTKRRRGRCTS